MFTGSHTSEYGQTSTAKSSLGKCYACVPNSPAAGIWANQQLAFIEADFVFYSAQAILIDQGFCLLETALNNIWELHLRFCFDKSKNNFAIRKHTFVCLELDLIRSFLPSRSFDELTF
jgi:hypothetical protein